MARKPDKRKMVRWMRAIAKVRNRKNNPPVRGRKITLQERNKPVLDKLAKALGIK
ncbi:MAG: hypothetical protein RMM53_07565 [Bacteroidia bacterium]|nr:hypothetical protein [Bacteroidia bacterium]MDW8334057.1 hypothetical protein [Bacteroidia bacterium]